ncbi:Hypothetical predicted protein [Xyrichtys novacula]|uniref:Uncharacterized protein n=1 Tax=Xyrichtys novacula TaxID=13765 RepID=A0AAV1G7D6_XYRNO|nr:Hypothetical predicted protein [Xyrichtys novacula]
MLPSGSQSLGTSELFQYSIHGGNKRRTDGLVCIPQTQRSDSKCALHSRVLLSVTFSVRELHSNRQVFYFTVRMTEKIQQSVCRRLFTHILANPRHRSVPVRFRDT